MTVTNSPTFTCNLIIVLLDENVCVCASLSSIYMYNLFFMMSMLALAVKLYHQYTCIMFYVSTIIIKLLVINVSFQTIELRE